MPKSKSGVATALDLGNHETGDWMKAHGIWKNVRGKVPSREDAYVNVYLSADHSGLTENAWEQIMLDTETEDVAGLFGSSLFTAPAAGLYIIDACASFSHSGASAQGFRTGIFKNGALLVQGGRVVIALLGSQSAGLPVATVARLAGGDTVGLYAYCTAANGMKVLGGATLTWMTIAMLR